MIIKLRQPVDDLKRFCAKQRFVMAKRMTRDFMCETGIGWVTGKTGDWLVLTPIDLWTVVSDDQFLRTYQPELEGGNGE